MLFKELIQRGTFGGERKGAWPSWGSPLWCWPDDCLSWPAESTAAEIVHQSWTAGVQNVSTFTCSLPSALRYGPHQEETDLGLKKKKSVWLSKGEAIPEPADNQDSHGPRWQDCLGDTSWFPADQWKIELVRMFCILLSNSEGTLGLYMHFNFNKN